MIRCLLVALLWPAVAVAADFKAGVATVVITPTEPLWMAGYGARTKPAEGKEMDLKIKALALEDPQGERLVLVTSDLVGIDRDTAAPVLAEVTKQTGLSRERLMLTTSHTHCGPVLADNLYGMYPLTPDQPAKIRAYTKTVQAKFVEVIVAAVKNLKPAKLSVGMGKAGFAVNRRKPTDTGFANAPNPGGPVDHDVPVLRVDTPDGKLLAVAFGYACHNTTMQYYQWSGDYAGFAMLGLEEMHPGATALFWAGCGADANPLPRSQIELCKKYGKDLATAVDTVLAEKPTPVTGLFAARYAEIPLRLDKQPTKQQLAADALSKNVALRNRAEKYLKVLEAGGQIPDRYPHYPVQVWRIGDQATWVSLGGEVVVDYSHRLKKELAGPRAVWVTAYSNDVMAYIPSERVLKEGGYEGESSMIPYGMPGIWAPGLEAAIVGKVTELVKDITK